jgi:hypothetical protein
MARSENGYADSVKFKVFQDAIPIEKFSTITVSFSGAGGGGGYGTAMPSADMERMVFLTFLFYDANGQKMSMISSILLYSYDEGEDMPGYNPESGVKNTSVTLDDILREAGINNRSKARYVYIQVDSCVFNTYGVPLIPKDWDGTPMPLTPMWIALNISGIPCDDSCSASQQMENVAGPAAVTNERQPEVTAKITSNGASITGVWGRYASANPSAWEAATPVDGAFDSASEEFRYKVSAPLEDGDHIIEIKALNANGEDDAVYYTYHFRVGNSGLLAGGPAGTLAG